MTARRKLIGGFFELELPQPNGGFSRLWNLSPTTTGYFTNARSGFAKVIEWIAPETVWLPAYICREMAAAVPQGKLKFYQVGEDLRADTDQLAEAAKSGDMVLAVNYFGRPCEADFSTLAAERPDLLFVEDCAHSLEAGTTPWCRWRLFSPRKLVGLPDGGILVARHEIDRVEPTGISRHWDPAVFEAALRRYEDRGERENQLWHAANMARESRETCSGEQMSTLAKTLLGLIDPFQIVERRRRNYNTLANLLGSLAYFEDAVPGFVPFGFPIRVQGSNRQQFADALSAEGIFAACHWRNLPSPEGDFPAEHLLASELITLPCDHRYDAADMERVAARVKIALR